MSQGFGPDSGDGKGASTFVKARTAAPVQPNTVQQASRLSTQIAPARACFR